MNDSETRKTVIVNIAYWIVAILVHPVLRMLPSASGSPPKIFELLAPLIMLGLAFGSTVLLKRAIKGSKS